MQPVLNFHRLSNLSPNAFDFQPQQLVIAGWTGRDRAALEHHVEELAALGVARPSTMPVYYRAAVTCLTQESRIQVLGNTTSGEVEPVLFSMSDGLWLGIGSDHTDRTLETQSVALSKQICPKVVGRGVWDCREIAAHWDSIIVRSLIIEGKGKPVAYQEGTLGQILSPVTLVEGYAGSAGLPFGTLMFCGTFPAKGGIRQASTFIMEMEDPLLKRRLRHSYEIETLPVVA